MESKEKRQEYKTTIGPLLKQCLIKQKESINKICYGKMKTSDYYAGEVLAKKILDGDIV